MLLDRRLLRCWRTKQSAIRTDDGRTGVASAADWRRLTGINDRNELKGAQRSRREGHVEQERALQVRSRPLKRFVSS